MISRLRLQAFTFVNALCVGGSKASELSDHSRFWRSIGVLHVRARDEYRRASVVPNGHRLWIGRERGLCSVVIAMSSRRAGLVVQKVSCCEGELRILLVTGKFCHNGALQAVGAKELNETAGEESEVCCCRAK